MCTRLPLIISDAPLLTEDLCHLVLGEKMVTGAFIYKDIIDAVPPVSALIYWLLGSLFGRSILAFQLLAAFLIFFQALLFRHLCNKNDLMSEKGDVPAFVYIICSMLCYDFMSLSPCLISLTFILIALNRIFKHIKSENNEGEIFATGFYIGVAYLCFAPAIIFAMMGYIAFVLYTRTSIRYYMLLFTGFIFPTLCAITYFFYFDNLPQFFDYFIFNLPIRSAFLFGFDIGSVAIMTLPVILLTLMGFFAMAKYNRFINYQIICQQLMLIWLVLVLGLILFFFSKTLTSFMLLLPFAAYFISHYIILTNRKRFANVLIFLFIINSLQLIYCYLSGSIYPASVINFSQQETKLSEWNMRYQNKKIAFFGDDMSVFINNKQATPYFDWQLSKSYLQGMDYYSKVVHVYNGFRQDMPDVIIDTKNVMPKVLERIPEFERTYKKTQYIGVYEKR